MHFMLENSSFPRNNEYTSISFIFCLSSASCLSKFSSIFWYASSFASYVFKIFHTKCAMVLHRTTDLNQRLRRFPYSLKYQKRYSPSQKFPLPHDLRLIRAHGVLSHETRVPEDSIFVSSFVQYYTSIHSIDAAHKNNTGYIFKQGTRRFLRTGCVLFVLLDAA